MTTTILSLVCQNMSFNTKYVIKHLITNMGPCEEWLSHLLGHIGIQLRVIDTGIGIPASDIRRIFSPFVQLSPTTTHGPGRLQKGLSEALLRFLNVFFFFR